MKERPDFGDVNAGDWYYDWVYGAVDLGLVNGKGKGEDGRDRFDPLGQITFAETAKLAACLHQLHTAGAVTLKNGDPWYKTYVDYCAENGILAASAENGGITADDVMKRASEMNCHDSLSANVSCSGASGSVLPPMVSSAHRILLKFFQ